jgi:hypothetical protein
MRCLFGVLALTAALSPALAQPCANHVLPGYGSGSLTGTVNCGAVFDDHTGTGPALFIGGNGYPGTMIAQQPMSLAKLVDGRWMSDASISGHVNFLTVIDDGAGPSLYLAGDFRIAPSTDTVNVAKWDGAAWTAFPSVDGTGLTTVNCVALHDDGSGPALYIGGALSALSPPPSQSCVMRLSGPAWTSFGGGVSGAGPIARVLLSYNDGTGSKLYAGGAFSIAGTATLTGLASWDGVAWSAVGSGFQSGLGSDVHSLAVYDDGGGPGLYAAGAINLPDRHNGNSPVALWRNGVWTRVLGIGAGLPGDQGAAGLLVFDDGTGPALYTAVGQLAESANQVWRLRGTSWSTVGSAFATTDPLGAGIYQFVSLPTPAGNRLVAVGNATSSGAGLAAPASKLNEGQWIPLETGAMGLMNAATMACDEDSPDAPLFSSGLMLTPSGWSANTGSEPYPAAGYVHTRINGAPATLTGNSLGVCIKTGATWQSFPTPGPGLFKLVSVDVGSGPSLYAIMIVSSAEASAKIERWNGASWEDVGPTLTGPIDTNAINALAAFDDGTGPALFVGGSFAATGGSYLAKLVNGAWVAVGNLVGAVNDMVVFDVGSGPELILAGTFAPNSAPIRALARWNGTRLAAVGSGVGSTAVGTVLRIFDDGAGPRLWAGSTGSGSYGLMRWSGSTWEVPIPPPLAGSWVRQVTSLAATNRTDGTRSLFVGGAFTSANGVPSDNVAEIACCRRTCTADFDGDGTLATDLDIEAFFECLAGNCCATCASMDFNHDGAVSTDADIESFFRVLAGGPC